MKTVSIVIPSRNEEKYIGQCLDSIINTTYPKELLSVLVCDGLSTDNTPQVILSYEEKYSYITYLRNEHRTTPYALNLGIQHNKSDIVIILGAHSTIAPDFIEQCLKTFEINSEIGCVGGIVKNTFENEVSEVIGFAMSQPFGVGTSYFRTGNKEGYVDTVPFGAYKREVFDKVGYFNTHLVRNQDDEFNFRLSQAGIKIYLNKDIVSHYVVRASFYKLFRQYYQYGYWKVYVNKMHGKITTFRQLIPFLFVVFLLGGMVLASFSNILMWIYLGAIFLYLLFGFAASFKKKMTLKRHFEVMACFATLHLSYGLGYANGIIDFFIRRRKPEQKMSELTR